MAFKRSSSHKLNRVLRKLDSLELATFCYPVYAYVRSAVNPDDAPSRSKIVSPRWGQKSRARRAAPLSSVAARRARRGRSRDIRVSATMRQRYWVAAQWFLAFLGSWHLPDATDARHLDDHVALFIERPGQLAKIKPTSATFFAAPR